MSSVKNFNNMYQSISLDATFWPMSEKRNIFAKMSLPLASEKISALKLDLKSRRCAVYFFKKGKE